jgi:hypothetical protein
LSGCGKRCSKGHDKHVSELLPVMSNLSRDNHGFKWILLIIDVFTRQGYAEGMKSKEASDVLSAFKKITDKTWETFCLDF